VISRAIVVDGEVAEEFVLRLEETGCPSIQRV
jgi:hypothetical protein